MKFLLPLLFAACACRAQGTLSLVNPATPPVAGYAAGATVPLNITKTGNPTTTALQFDITAPANSATITFAVGPAVTAGTKLIQCSPAPFPVRCILFGLANAAPIPDGTVVVASVTLPGTTAVNPVPVTISAPIESDSGGNGLTVAVGNPTVSLPLKSGCDVNSDGTTTGADTQVVVNAVTARTTSVATDLDSNSKTDALDVQIAATSATPPLFTCNAH